MVLRGWGARVCALRKSRTRAREPGGAAAQASYRSAITTASHPCPSQHAVRSGCRAPAARPCALSARRWCGGGGGGGVDVLPTIRSLWLSLSLCLSISLSISLSLDLSLDLSLPPSTVCAAATAVCHCRHRCRCRRRRRRRRLYQHILTHHYILHVTLLILRTTCQPYLCRRE